MLPTNKNQWFSTSSWTYHWALWGGLGLWMGQIEVQIQVRIFRKTKVSLKKRHEQCRNRREHVLETVAKTWENPRRERLEAASGDEQQSINSVTHKSARLIAASSREDTADVRNAYISHTILKKHHEPGCSFFDEFHLRR